MATRRNHRAAVRDREVARHGGVYCWGCWKPLELPERSMVVGRWYVDHMWPLAVGGPDTLENCQPLCGTCHRDKTAGEAKQRALLRHRRSRPMAKAYQD
jgi:5-methylcytosine-specific restriction endonuclease McrA